MSNWASTDLDEVAVAFGWERKHVDHDMTPNAAYDTTVTYEKDGQRITADFRHYGDVYGDWLARASHQEADSDSVYRREQTDEGAREAFGVAVMWMVDAARGSQN